MKNIGVRNQLKLAFGTLTGLLIIMAIFSTTRFLAQYANFQGYIEGTRARAEAVHAVRQAIDLRAIAARDLIVVTNEVDRSDEKRVVFQAHAEVHSQLEKLKELVKQANTSNVAREQIKRIEKVEQKYGPVALAIVDLALRDHQDEAIIKLNAECRPLLAELIAATDDYEATAAARSATALRKSEQEYTAGRNMLIIFSLAACTISITAGALITKNLLRTLGTEPVVLKELVNDVANGDLRARRSSVVTESVSVLSSVQRMQSALTGVIASVRENALNVSSASSDIAAGNADLAKRTAQQASSLEQTACSMEQMTSTVTETADSAVRANLMAITASEIAEKGGDLVRQVADTMSGILNASEQIVHIIDVIDNIAFQTNILALNASIEAAHAGEHGRGFAIVALEVRNLAHRSAGAAKQIQSLISNSVERVNAGVELADKAGITMSTVVQHVRDVSGVIAQISTATKEQSSGIAQISQALNDMDLVTQQNSTLVNKGAAAAESLNLRADELVKVVSTFKIDTADKPIKSR